MSMIERMEKKYGIKIVDDSFYHPLTGRYYKRYKIYTADGCKWENGLTFRDLQKECREYGEEFIKIYNRKWLKKGG